METDKCYGSSIKRELMILIQSIDQLPDYGHLKDQDSITYFKIKSYGMTGEQWCSRQDVEGVPMDCNAERVLLSSEFKLTDGVTTYIAVIPGILFPNRSEHSTKNIRAEACKRSFSKPTPEDACLMGKKFTNKDIERKMGFSRIIIMHKPIDDCNSNPSLLVVGRRYRDDGCRMETLSGRPDAKWSSQVGSAFVLKRITSNP
jgi:hypothetical protein